ncbi:MAG: BMP family ABC transporter substrate-binding protein, partial [Actinobacteria bacterium]|nr:BMP family ABC transporter substrate-binding protein [Actinomycetota bacterium]
MRSSIVKAVVAAGMLAGLSALPATAEFKLDGEPKVAMIIFGPKNDGGWSQSYDEARQRMEKS